MKLCGHWTDHCHKVGTNVHNSLTVW